MKKIVSLLLGLLVTAAVALVGYGLIKNGGWPTFKLPSSQPVQQSKGPVPTGIVISTVKEFVDKGSTTVCQVPDGKEVYIAMIKGKKVRINNFPSKSGGRVEVLIKDGKVYSWKDGSTKGVVAKAEGTGIDKEVYDSLEKNKNSCLNGDAADFVFELPKEVVFK